MLGSVMGGPQWPGVDSAGEEYTHMHTHAHARAECHSRVHIESLLLMMSTALGLLESSSQVISEKKGRSHLIKICSYYLELGRMGVMPRRRGS